MNAVIATATDTQIGTLVDAATAELEELASRGYHITPELVADVVDELAAIYAPAVVRR